MGFYKHILVALTVIAVAIIQFQSEYVRCMEMTIMMITLDILSNSYAMIILAKPANTNTSEIEDYLNMTQEQQSQLKHINFTSSSLMDFYGIDVKIFTMIIIASFNNNDKVTGKRYLECGSGGSTELVLELNKNVNNKFYSVDHVTYWCNLMKSKAIIKTNIETNILHYIQRQPFSFSNNDTNTDYPYTYLPIGIPDLSNKTGITELMFAYVDQIDNFNESAYDVVLIDIDGRFRINCALKLIFGGYIHHDSMVLVHDYYNRRFKYNIIEKYYDVVPVIEPYLSTLACFRVKKECLENLDDFKEELFADFERYSQHWL